jgi:ACS family hexuronate transporter-like MFS transporter
VNASAVEAGLPGRYRILVLILAAQTMANVGPLGLPAIAALIREDLGLTLPQAGSFLSLYYIGPVLMSVPAGFMTDRWGMARTLIAGQAVIGVGLLGVAASGSYAMLVAMLIASGFGYGMLNPTSTKVVIGWFPFRQRATMVGFKQVGLPFGGALGAALMPALALQVGWRTAVVISGLILVTTALASVIVYRDPPLAPLAPGGPSALRMVLLSRDLWLVSISTLVFAGMQTVWMGYLVLYLRDVVGISLVLAGGYLALAQVAGMVGRVAFGVLSDRVFSGRRRATLMLAGMGSALCSLAMAWTGPGSPATWLTVLALVFGFVGIGWNGVQHTLMAEMVGPRAAGTAVGFGLAVSSAGVTLAPPIFGKCVEWAGYGPVWIGLALTMVGALALLALVRERRPFITA